MNKLAFVFTLGLISLCSLGLASPRKGLYVQGYFGPSTLTEAEETEIGPTLGLSLGYGLSQKLVLAGTFNLYMPSTESDSVDTKYILLGGDLLFYPLKNIGLYFGAHIGAAVLAVTYSGSSSGSYSLVSSAAGPKIGYEFDLTPKLSCGIDLNLFFLGKATGTMNIGGSQIDVTSKENGIISGLLYLKYYFA